MTELLVFPGSNSEGGLRRGIAFEKTVCDHRHKVSQTTHTVNRCLLILRRVRRLYLTRLCRYGSYAKLLGLCARNRRFKEAEEVFNESLQLNTRPHPGTFGAMLNACTFVSWHDPQIANLCSYARILQGQSEHVLLQAEERLPISPVYAEKAANVIQRMQNEHGLKPSEYHFHALMDVQVGSPVLSRHRKGIEDDARKCLVCLGSLKLENSF